MLQFNYDIRAMNFFWINFQNKYINFAFLFTQQYINKEGIEGKEGCGIKIRENQSF